MSVFVLVEPTASVTACRSEGIWREPMFADRVEPSRVLFPGRVPYETYLALLQRPDAHVYLPYPFVGSWSLREALSIRCVVIGSDAPTVREFITHDENRLLVSCFDPKGLANTVLKVLENAPLARRLRDNARRYAEQQLAIDDDIAAYEALICRITHGGLRFTPPQRDARPDPRRSAHR
jgi:glycosyltransferase involved in cell wall biosynthesis